MKTAVVAVIFSILLCPTMYNGLSLAESSDTPDYIISDSPVDVSVSLNKTELNINEKLAVAFSFPGKPKTWYYKSDSIELIDERETDGEIYIDIIPGVGAGRFSLYIDLGSGVQKETVYMYAECGKGGTGGRGGDGGDGVFLGATAKEGGKGGAGGTGGDGGIAGSGGFNYVGGNTIGNRTLITGANGTAGDGGDGGNGGAGGSGGKKTTGGSASAGDTGSTGDTGAAGVGCI